MLSTSEFEDVACPLCGKNESQLHMFRQRFAWCG